MQLCKILGEEEAVQTGVNLVDNGGPSGDGGLGVRVEEDILGSGGGGLRFRQDLWTSAEAAPLGAAAGCESERRKRIPMTAAALWMGEA
uniref:Uncharacterized protein n=1 Tax=Oryza glumipatula TaxID=40148 RepID=A0A0E0BH22_9ORYZ